MSTTTSEEASGDSCPLLVLVSGIPKSFRSHHLRRFFSSEVESGSFGCFHFRHRPTKDGSASCCVARLASRAVLDRLVAARAGTHWIGDGDEELDATCTIAVLSAAEAAEVAQMPELRPPSCMPQGNVGTPTQFFLRAVQACKLPAKIIGKLKLEFPSTRGKRKYASVPMQYGEDGRDTDGRDLAAEERDRQGGSGSGSKAKAEAEPGPSSGKRKKKKSRSPSPEANISSIPASANFRGVDDDNCEEWERHEALHDDLSARRAWVEGADLDTQPGTKDRLFEEEMEITWDKGSSGLVFYTDAQFWKEQEENNFDKQTADDWDLDMNVYYDGEDNGAHDRDARDLFVINQERRRERNRYRPGGDGDGAQKSVFARPAAPRAGPKGASSSKLVPGPAPKIGSFEKHTKGIGRRLLERQGWTDGRGLGRASRPGRAEALEGEGQTCKSGLGYRGGPADDDDDRRWEEKRHQTRIRFPDHEDDPGQVKISTVYDDEHKTDPEEKYNRRNPDHHLKYRQKPLPKKGQ